MQIDPIVRDYLAQRAQLCEQAAALYRESAEIADKVRKSLLDALVATGIFESPWLLVLADFEYSTVYAHESLFLQDTQVVRRACALFNAYGKLNGLALDHGAELQAQYVDGSDSQSLRVRFMAKTQPILAIRHYGIDVDHREIEKRISELVDLRRKFGGE